MRNEQKSWGTMVICAFAVVSLIVIGVATFRSCSKQNDESASEPLPAVEEVVEVTAPAPVEKETDEYEWEAEFREQIEEQMQAPEREYIGRCRLTVYNSTESSWGYATATGAKSQHLMTCAVDPKVIPYGSIVIIVDKDGEEHRFRAVDCGGFSGKWVDIFFDDSVSHGIQWLDECFGGEFAEVWYEEGWR